MNQQQVPPMDSPTYDQLVADNQKFRKQLRPRSAWGEQFGYVKDEPEPQGPCLGISSDR